MPSARRLQRAATHPEEYPSPRVFAPDSFWYTPIPDDAPTHPNSAALVAYLDADRQSAYGGTVNINTVNFAAPVYIATPDTPFTSVGFSDRQQKGYKETGFLSQVNHVPIPQGARFAEGTDQEMCVWSPHTDELWEFWFGERFVPPRPEGTYTVERSDGSTFETYYYANTGQTEHTYYATWGGRMQNVSTNPGIFPWPIGTTATGLPFLGGQISIAEAQALNIPHALGLATIKARSGGQSWPANRNDGWTNDANCPYEGQRFYLSRSVDVNVLPMHPLGKAIARSIQKYGFVIWDKAGAFSFRGENPIPLIDAGQSNPWSTVYNGTPSYSIMAGFPWTQLIALPHDYGKPA